jgi:uncharacterized SAM-binding protein YcdF (DUF218 family)
MKVFKKILKVILYFHLVLILVAVLVQCSFKRYAKKSYQAASKQIPFDVVIVPGVPFQDTATHIVYKARVLWAKHLYDSGFTKNIIFSGSAVYTPYIESRTMKLYAEALGVPSENIFTEEKAEHSTENVYYGWKMAKALGFKKIALATDPFQSGMLRSMLREHTPDMMSLPVQFEKINAIDKVLPLINAATALVHPFVSLPNRVGFWERLRGTMGKRVKAEAKRDRKEKKTN